MFLQARNAIKHSVSLGVSLSGLVVQGELVGENNVFSSTKRFVPATTYFWRVDAIFADGSKQLGNVWNFTAGCADLGCVDCGQSTAKASCKKCVSGLSVYGGIC